MKKYGTPMNHTAWQIIKEYSATFDYILCIDESNLKDLNRKKGHQVKNCKAKIILLGSYNMQKQIIIEDNSPIMKMPLTLRLSTSRCEVPQSFLGEVSLMLHAFLAAVIVHRN